MGRRRAPSPTTVSYFEVCGTWWYGTAHAIGTVHGRGYNMAWHGVAWHNQLATPRLVVWVCLNTAAKTLPRVHAPLLIWRISMAHCPLSIWRTSMAHCAVVNLVDKHACKHDTLRRRTRGATSFVYYVVKVFETNPPPLFTAPRRNETWRAVGAVDYGLAKTKRTHRRLHTAA